MSGQAVILSAFLSLAAPEEVIFADGFESGYAYAWSSSETDTPWWQRQFTEGCPEYALRYHVDDLWGCCCCTSPTPAAGQRLRKYWTRRPGTASGHACGLMNGDEYIRPIFFSDFEFHWIGWDAVVGARP